MTTQLTLLKLEILDSRFSGRSVLFLRVFISGSFFSLSCDTLELFEKIFGKKGGIVVSQFDLPESLF